MTKEPPHESRYELETDLTVDEALAAVGRAAELWGADWARHGRAGRITLPVNSGVRTGLLGGRLEASQGAAGALLALDVDESRYDLNRQAVALLVAGGASGVILMLWPFFPVLLGLAPIAIVMALITWFVVVSRLRNNGPREFLDFVVELGAIEPDPDESDPGATAEPE